MFPSDRSQRVPFARVDYCNCSGTGYTGTVCDEDVDECEEHVGRDAHACQRNSTCVNVAGSYRCNCPPSFTGIIYTLIIIPPPAVLNWDRGQTDRFLRGWERFGERFLGYVGTFMGLGLSMGLLE